MGKNRGLQLSRILAWDEGDVSYYLYGSPPGPSGRVLVLTAIGPEFEHRWVVVPQGRSGTDPVDQWTGATHEERTQIAEELLRRGRSA